MPRSDFPNTALTPAQLHVLEALDTRVIFVWHRLEHGAMRFGLPRWGHPLAGSFSAASMVAVAAMVHGVGRDLGEAACASAAAGFAAMLFGDAILARLWPAEVVLTAEDVTVRAARRPQVSAPWPSVRLAGLVFAGHAYDPQALVAVELVLGGAPVLIPKMPGDAGQTLFGLLLRKVGAPWLHAHADSGGDHGPPG